MASTEHGLTVTELRIHGVGGASPEEVLDVPHVRLAAGNMDAGFFRPAKWLDTGLDWDVEAYSWGGITSRSRSRALWIFLLPFALLNVAGWMRDGPVSGSSEGSARGARKVALVRIESLVTTAVFTILIAILVIELIGYRCVAIDGCVSSWLLAPWAWFADDILDGVAVGTAVAALIMAGIATIARSRKRAQTEPIRGPLDPAGKTAVADPTLWARPDVANGLSLLHLAASLSLVSLAGAEAAARLTGQVLDTLVVVSVAVLLLSTAFVLGFESIPGPVRWATAAGSFLLVAVTVTVITGLEADVDTVIADPVLTFTTYTVFATFLVLFVTRWIAYLWRRVVALLSRSGSSEGGTDEQGRTQTAKVDRQSQMGKSSDDKRVEPLTPFSLGGWVGDAVGVMRQWAASRWRADRVVLLSLRAAVPVLGAGIAVAVGAGILLRVDGVLGTGYPTEVLDRVAVFGLGWIALTFLTALSVWFSNPGRTPDEIIEQDLSKAGLDPNVDRLWLQEISSAESVAKITDHVETVITVPAVVMFAVVVATAGGSVDAIDSLAGPASWVLSLIPLALILAFNSLYRSRNFRRTLGIIWDVATFWPKWFHPWAPPSYGERAVPHLLRRLQHLTRDGYVVLSGHSQGTVVAAAALSRLEEPARRRVAVITAGSPLTRLYSRYFGGVFPVDLYQQLAKTLGSGDSPSWSNLYRWTDYIGGPVFDGEGRPPTDSEVAYLDRRLLDPPSPEPLMPGDDRPRPLNHSNYYQDPAYHTTVERLVRGFRSSE